jgi:DNA-binding NarL/FixJ family response regulator
VSVGIAVGIVENHPIFRNGLAGYVEDAPDLELTQAVASIGELAECQAAGGAHVVLLDLHLDQGIDGPAAITHLRGQGHVVLVVSASAQPDRVITAMAAGAAGYVSKNAEPEEILLAIRTVASGSPYFSAGLAGYLLDQQRHVRLSARQVEVLRLVARGDTNQEIARQLHISPATVSNYLEKIREKTGQRRRPAMTKYAIENGLLDDRNQ